MAARSLALRPALAVGILACLLGAEAARGDSVSPTSQDEAIAAVRSGHFEAAADYWQPLAEDGHAVAQSSLAGLFGAATPTLLRRRTGRDMTDAP